MIVILKDGDILDNTPELRYKFKDDIIVKIINCLNIQVSVGLISRDKYLEQIDVLSMGTVRIAFDLIEKSVNQNIRIQFTKNNIKKENRCNLEEQLVCLDLREEIEKITWRARFGIKGQNYLYCNMKETSIEFKKFIFQKTPSL